ncbi:acetyl-CoA carboxylase biotin carboxylase subunit [Candidatus Chloroploca sp. Khr17]|uniref:acetyl/propionyl/methylcrotonyl-CoA carboxylase subunit alpha n=1 Tax=Candidatus Chloroploca sp. Khr17 TaxID=2496869 RepID=UPI00101C6E14|nr:acetyl-CoA carboxylase biotin carboxylase subunit [Candidatus Chloroploca sp. Khr17]
MQRMLIANRGEIAVRILRACRELGISPVAVYSEADASAMHVRLADAAVCLGPPAATQSYLRGEAILAAAHATGAEAIHPGYGFLAENAAFARMCREAGMIFVGPPPEAIEAMGGKIGARHLATAAGVPVVPGYDGPDQSDERLMIEAARIGTPLLIKASAGGGGKGMRVVTDLAGFTDALAGARREARAAFGDDAVLLERLIVRPRHIEIQVLADAYGTVLHLGERECSIQRRHQKILEEAPSPALSPALRATMGEAAVRVARAAGYVNAGTVEFVLDPEGHFYFLEMNTRLQVEHPVTELVTGLDLVRWQIAIAKGEPLTLTQSDIAMRGHAIEVRLYAEDPVSYLPAIGQLALFAPPTGPGIRVDAGLSSGDEVTVHYDPMIAKLIVAGEDRTAAVERLRAALEATVVLGLTTNLALLRALAAHPAYRAGATHTGFLSDYPLDLEQPAEAPLEVILAGAILAQHPSQPTSATPLRHDPFALHWRMGNTGVPVRFRSGDHDLVAYTQHRGNDWTIDVQGTSHPVRRVMQGATECALEFGGRLERFLFAHDRSGDLLIGWRGNGYRLTQPAPLSADSATRPGGGHDAAGLTAPMPGTLIKLLVSEGEAIEEGQPLMILEAMKMEHTVVAPYSGVVRRLPFAQGASVTGGVNLIELEAEEGALAIFPNSR